MDQPYSFLPLVAIALLFWLMVVRPASRRQKAIARLQADLLPGQRVMLSSGIFGTIRSLDDDRAIVEIAPGAEIEVARAAIAALEQPADTVPESRPDSGPESSPDSGTESNPDSGPEPGAKH